MTQQNQPNPPSRDQSGRQQDQGRSDSDRQQQGDNQRKPMEQNQDKKSDKQRQ